MIETALMAFMVWIASIAVALGLLCVVGFVIERGQS